MQRDLLNAKALLTGRRTLVLKRGDEVIFSEERGVAPLVSLLSRDFSGFCAADRVVGKGAAFCYIALSVKSVWAAVISVPAKEFLEKHGVAVYCDTLTERIENRTRTGFCPIEAAVLNIDDTETAIDKIKQTLLELKC